MTDRGWGFGLGGTYVVLQNVEVRNAYAQNNKEDSYEPNSGAIRVSGKNTILQNAYVHDSNWSSSQNTTGILVQYASDIVLDRVTATNNYDRRDHPQSKDFLGSMLNSSNFLFYTEAPSSGTFYVLNCRSEGSRSGYKVKHQGAPARIIVHNSVSKDDDVGFSMMDDQSSVRYSTAIDSHSFGIHLASGEVNGDQVGKYGSVLLEHNNVVNSGAAGILTIGGTVPNPVITKNIVYQKNRKQSDKSYEPEYRNDWPLNPASFMDLGDKKNIMAKSNYPKLKTKIDFNAYYAPNIGDSEGFRFGYTSMTESITEWTKRGYDKNTMYGKDPLFFDVNNEKFSMPLTSPVIFNGADRGFGAFAGAGNPKIK